MSTSTVVPFRFESHEVRALSIDGEPWFVARDVCEVLEYPDASDATRGLDEDEKLIREITGAGQSRNMLLISESGLYTLIIRSNKPQAKPFRKWVTGEVLPSIRKTGGYTIQGGRKSRVDFHHHRGPVSESGLDIRYTLDLTKVILHPTRNSLALLQRLTGIDLDELAEVAADLTPGNATTESIRGFIDECAHPLHGAKITLKDAQVIYERWCASRNIEKFRMASSRLLAASLRKAGYAVEKRGGVVVVHGMALSEVAV